VSLRPRDKLANLVRELRGDQPLRKFSKEVGVSYTTISFWEQGKVWPDDEHLERLAQLKGLTFKELYDELEGEIETNAKNAYERLPTFQRLLIESRLKPDPLEKIAAEGSILPIVGGQLPDISRFYGRQIELAMLKEIFLSRRCGCIYGQAGIGKSTLVAKAIEQIAKEPFKYKLKYCIWKSINYGPTLDSLLTDLVNLSSQLLAQEPTEVIMPKDTQGKVSALIDFLRTDRSLLVLDSIDVILKRERETAEIDWNPGGQYSEYRTLFRRLIEEKHESCIILTSTEPVLELIRLQQKGFSARSDKIGGLDEEAREFFRAKRLDSEDKWGDIIEKQGGNPSLLKAVVQEVEDFWNGNIDNYLKNQPVHVGEPVESWLNKRFEDRFNEVSIMERQVLYYVATRVNQSKAVPITQLLQEVKIDKSRDIQPSLHRIINALINGSLLEKANTLKGEILISLSPVIEKYIESDPLGLFKEFSLS